MTRVLGIDFGSKRIGLAKSDEAGIMAHGLGFVECRRDGSHIQEIIKIIRSEKINTVVIGYPINMNGSIGSKARESERFAEMLREALRQPRGAAEPSGRPPLEQAAGVEVKLWDERLTSKEAERYLLEADVSRAKRKKKIDQLAAQIMLQGYIDAQSK